MITVITPFYNAAPYLEQCIASVMEQPEVTVHMLIDDGSTDGSVAVVEQWREKDSRVHLLRHPDGKNHGRSATRNLGLRHAATPYLAFLDADDFYLPGRFKKDLQILESSPDLDGVYNAIGLYVYNDFTGDLESLPKLTTINKRVAPEALFDALPPFGDAGRFSGDGLTIRASLLQRTGLFNEALQVAEDSDLWYRMALVGRLEGGCLDQPVAIRGVHGDNVFYRREHYPRAHFLLYHNLFRFARQNNAKHDQVKKIWAQRLRCYRRLYPDRRGEVRIFFNCIFLLFRYPALWTEPLVWAQPVRSLVRIVLLTFKSHG